MALYIVCHMYYMSYVYYIEFDKTVIQVEGLASFKTRFNPPVST